MCLAISELSCTANLSDLPCVFRLADGQTILTRERGVARQTLGREARIEDLIPGLMAYQTTVTNTIATLARRRPAYQEKCSLRMAQRPEETTRPIAGSTNCKTKDDKIGLHMGQCDDTPHTETEQHKETHHHGARETACWHKRCRIISINMPEEFRKRFS